MYFGPAAAVQRACTLLCVSGPGGILFLSPACNMFNSAACTHQINCTDHQSRAPMPFFLFSLLARLPFIQLNSRAHWLFAFCFSPAIGRIPPDASLTRRRRAAFLGINLKRLSVCWN